MSDTKSSGSSIGFSGLLTLIFITLKLTGVINWSWWWVLAPTWITLGMVLVIIVAFLLAALVIAAFKNK